MSKVRTITQTMEISPAKSETTRVLFLRANSWYVWLVKKILKEVGANR